MEGDGPGGVELGAGPDEEFEVGDDAPGGDEADEVGEGEVCARGAGEEVEVEGDDEGSDEPARNRRGRRACGSASHSTGTTKAPAKPPGTTKGARAWAARKAALAASTTPPSRACAAAMVGCRFSGLGRGYG